MFPIQITGIDEVYNLEKIFFTEVKKLKIKLKGYISKGKNKFSESQNFGLKSFIDYKFIYFFHRFIQSLFSDTVY